MFSSLHTLHLGFGPCFNIKTIFLGISKGISMIKMRRLWDCLIFIIRIPIFILGIPTLFLYIEMTPWLIYDVLVQEGHNSIANALELCLSCTNPLIYSCLVITVCRFSMVPSVLPIRQEKDRWICLLFHVMGRWNIRCRTDGAKLSCDRLL